MASKVRIGPVAIKSDSAVFNSKTIIDTHLVASKEELVIKGAGYTAIVGIKLETGEIIADVDRKIRKRPVIQTLSALATKACNRVK